MIDRQRLLADLKPLLKALEADLRARCDEEPLIDAGLKTEYEEARAADRTGVAYEEWRADLITQVAVAWVLSCVFVRFLEDNALVHPPVLSGPLHGGGTDAGLQRARDERDAYFKTHPKQTDRDYLLDIFDRLARLPGTRDVFGPHNPALAPAYRNWLSGDAAQRLIEFFQKIDADGTGEIVHDFADPAWDTRFLGDLYQDLSEAARKKYALLQTPVFVEEFILDRTLEPAIAEFGLDAPPIRDSAGTPITLPGIRMIDPACGSGHFLLGGFARILKHWRKKEPAAGDRKLVNRALAAVHGVDLNPYAVAIARFRLLIAAMRECHITSLADALDFKFNLVCGDSLQHGAPGMEQEVMGFHPLAHVYRTEDLPGLQRLLRPGIYHAVVANPPYITVKDKALNQAYRDRYPQVCHLKYSLSVPFLQRLFTLACDGGFTGQITANSFMKREFGKKLVESYLPTIDLTHVIDTSGAYIPGHGTPTVILLVRNRPPTAQAIRVVMGIRGEPATPTDPAHGLVWTAIGHQIDCPGSQSPYLSVSDTPRSQFGKHPWSIGGGGAAELKEQLDGAGERKLNALSESIGITCFTLADDFFFHPADALSRRRVPPPYRRAVVVGDGIRDWSAGEGEWILFPYDGKFQPSISDPTGATLRALWIGRTVLANNIMFGRQTKVGAGLQWFEYGRLTSHKLQTPLSITFSNVATHNHFALDRGGRIFECHAPIIKLSATMDEDEHLALLGLLNSSIACFWMKQVFYPKATVSGDISVEKGKPENNRYEFAGTGLESFPIPVGLKDAAAARLILLARQADSTAQRIVRALPRAVIQTWSGSDGASLHAALAAAEQLYHRLRNRLIAIQEEIDWECYRLFGLCDQGASDAVTSDPAVGVVEGLRPFLWESDQTPDAVPPSLRAVYLSRRSLLRSVPSLALLETAVYKRPWWGRQGVYGRLSRDYAGWTADALNGWLLDRLESYFDLDGRMNGQEEVTARGDLREPRLSSMAKVSDLARADRDFMQVAELFTGRMDFDVGALVGELVAAESVPALPVLRYKPAAMDKRRAWERTWELQRLEDAVDALFEVEKLSAASSQQAALSGQPSALGGLQDKLPAESCKLIADNLKSAAAYVAEAVKQKLDLSSDTILKPVQDADRRARKAAVGDIPVPPKYTSADFQSGNYWRLRGKLDVPKERWVSFPHCEGEDGTLVIAWAGYDHLQLARAIAERYELAREQEGRNLVPLLAAIGQLIPWLKQWHNDLDPTYDTRMGDFFENYLAEEAKAIGKSVEEVMAWTPPEKPSRGRKRKS